MSEFDIFWAAYPKKLAKLDAAKAYAKARQSASAEDILAGVHRYREHLPDELRYVAHAATWLRAGRWLDEYDTPIAKPSSTAWWDECKELHGGQCEKRWAHEMKKREAS